MDKRHVALLFGGRSPEHQISLLSAQSIMKAIDRNTNRVTLIGIGQEGEWRHYSDNPFENGDNPKTIRLRREGQLIHLDCSPGSSLFVSNNGKPLECGRPNVIFAIMHGNQGEDGSIQGIFEVADVPYAGAGVGGSAVGMNKILMKHVLIQHGIEVTPFIHVEHSAPHPDWSTVSTRLGSNLFIKPANLGSSVGIQHVTSADEYTTGLEQAFQFDRTILIEQAIEGRELECALLGNETLTASVIGEICPHHDFYSYEAKYIDPDGAELIAPADIAPDLSDDIRDIACQTFRALQLKGLARIDFFLRSSDQKLFVNEVNTMPGFTSISMYPRLMELSGVSYTDLINRLLDLAIEEKRSKDNLQTRY